MSKDKINRIAHRPIPYDTITPRRALREVGKTQDGRVVRQAKSDYTGSLNEYAINIFNIGTNYKRLQNITASQNFILTVASNAPPTNPTEFPSGRRCTHICQNGVVSVAEVNGFSPNPYWKPIGKVPATGPIGGFYGNPIPIYVSAGSCIGSPNPSSPNQLEMPLEGFQRLCRDVDKQWNPNPSPTMATAGLLATAAATLLPTPTATIATSAPTTLVTGLAVGLGALGAAAGIAGVSYGAYKYGQYLKRNQTQNDVPI